jgi:hypothetical protein
MTNDMGVYEGQSGTREHVSRTGSVSPIDSVSLSVGISDSLTGQLANRSWGLSALRSLDL